MSKAISENMKKDHGKGRKILLLKNREISSRIGSTKVSSHVKDTVSKDTNRDSQFDIEEEFKEDHFSLR